MTGRTTETSLDTLFLDRWSPRAFDGSTMPRADMDTILDAGRWAPSAFNYQPWRFLFALRGDASWDSFVQGMIPFNQSWAGNASALVYFISEEGMGAPDKPNHSHSFDTGAAWAMMAMQAHMLGYHAHGMTGLDFAKAAEIVKLPSGFRLEAAAVFGRIGDPAILPEGLREREVPSTRKPLSEVAIEGPFTV